MIGKIISHYKILEKLGEGGMGVVYKAQDTKLDRIVALKFLPKHLLCDEEAKTRFVHEAKAASALNHPNITTIHEIDEAEGECFIAMEYVDGRSLKKLIEEKTLSLKEILDIAIQACEGLVIAHEKGIVHRDIKSDNIMLTFKGQIKIMDFGLAELKGASRLTKTGSTVGTLAYMSPEQAQGMEVDQRSDIFSFGVVLHEMITGQLPFKGEHEPAIIYSILNETPEPLARYKSNVPGALQQIVDKALAKERDERYQHVDEILADLKSAKRKIESGRTIQEPLKLKRLIKRPLYLYVSLAIIIILLILSKIYFFTSSKGFLDSIAVLPLQNLSGDPNQEYFSDGMTEALITELQKIKSLRVISRTSVMQYKKVQKLLPEIAKELGVRAVVEGSILRSGDKVRVTVQLMQASPEKHLWANTFDRNMQDILALQSDVAQAIAREIRIAVTPDEEARLTKSYQVNPEAHDAYLKGRYYAYKFTPEAVKKGLEYYEQAIEKDPNYAPAYAGLAVTYFFLGQPLDALPSREALSKSSAAATKAVELDDKLAEAHTALATAKLFYDWDWAGAEREYKLALELNPNSADAHTDYAVYLGVIGRHRESIAEIQRALDLDPFNLSVRALVGELFYYGREYDRAIEKLQKTLELDPNFTRAHIVLWWVYEAKGMYSEAVAAYQKYLSLTGVSPEEIAAVGNAYAAGGIRAVHRWLLETAIEDSKQGYVRSMYFASTYAALGEKDQAFAWLEKAYHERDGQLMFLKVDPPLDNLRSDPRFTALLKKVGFEQ